MDYSNFLTDITHTVSKVFNGTPQLNKFRPSIFIKSSSSIYGSYYRLILNRDGQSEFQHPSHTSMRKAANMGVHIVPFGSNIQSLRIDNISNFWSGIRIPGSQINHIASGVNLNKNIKTKGALINARTILSKKMSTYDEDHVLEWYYMGKNNIVIAVLLKNKSLFIRTQSLINIMAHSDPVEVELLLKRLFLLYDKILLESINTILFQNEDIAGLSLHHRRLYNHVMISLSKRSTIYQQIEPDTIVGWIESAVEKYYNNTCFGSKSDYSYSLLVKDIFETQQRLVASESKKAFNNGMEFGQKILDCGWARDSKKIQSFSGTIWSKQIEIIPDTFIHDNKRYLIPEDLRHWKLKTLYLLSDGTLYCMESHPNISDSGKVCTGTLNINLHAATEALKVLLDDIESLLEIVNFDSPHRRDYLDELLEKSELIEVLSETSKYVDYEVITADMDISIIEEGDTVIDDEEVIIQIKGNNTNSDLMLENESNVTNTRGLVRDIESAIDFSQNAMSVDGNEQIETDYTSMSLVHEDLSTSPVVIVLPASENEGAPNDNIVITEFILTPENIL